MDVHVGVDRSLQCTYHYHRTDFNDAKQNRGMATAVTDANDCLVHLSFLLLLIGCRLLCCQSECLRCGSE